MSTTTSLLPTQHQSALDGSLYSRAINQVSRQISRIGGLVERAIRVPAVHTKLTYFNRALWAPLLLLPVVGVLIPSKITLIALAFFALLSLQLLVILALSTRPAETPSFPPFDIQEEPDEELTPQQQLPRAIFLNDLQGVQQLLSSDQVDIRHVYAVNRTALLYAAGAGRTEIVQLLIAAGERLNPPVETQTYIPAFKAALEHGHVGVVETLLQAGVRVDQLIGGALPLCIASTFGHIGVIEALLRAGAEINAPCEDEHRFTPLMAAALDNNVKALRVLIRAGANLDLQDARGSTALVHGVRKRFYQTILCLLRAGANPNIPTLDSSTAVGLAGTTEVNPIRQLLISYGGRA